jgi:hypothetical protein
MLLRQPSTWMDPFLRIAAHLGDAEGVALAKRIGRAPRASSNLRRVRIVVRPPRHSIGSATPSLSLSFRWHADGYHTVFVLLEGRIVLRRAEDRTEVMIQGRVSAPEWLDDVGGNIVVRRAAVVTASRFLASLQTAIAEMGRMTQTI